MNDFIESYHPVNSPFVIFNNQQNTYTIAKYLESGKMVHWCFKTSKPEWLEYISVGSCFYSRSQAEDYLGQFNYDTD